MSQNIRVMICNTDDEVSNDLRAVVLAIDGVKIVAELDEPALLPQAIEQFPCEVLLIHLDPNPDAIMDVVEPVIRDYKEQFSAIAMTENRDAELVMRAMRAGMREFLWKPFPPEQLEETLRRVAAESGTSNRRVGRLISVVGTVGGVGATMASTNLAVELAQLTEWRGQPQPEARPKVAVVDLDLRFGQVAMQLDAQPSYTIADLSQSSEQLDPQMITRAMWKHQTGAHVLARPADFSQADQMSAAHAAGALAALQEHYDFVVVDMPGRFDPSARAVYDMADVYLLVLQLMVPSIRSADRILKELSSTGYATDRVKLLCNRFGRESAYLERADVETTLGRPINFVLPEEWRTCAAAVNMGSPLLTHAPKSRIRQSIIQMAKELAGTGAQEEDGANGRGESKKRIFGFLAGSNTG